MHISAWAAFCVGFLTLSRSTADSENTNLEDLPYSCESPIYCYGPLLDTIQNARLYSDSKEFVDMKMLYPADQILEDFDELMEQTNNNPSKDQIQDFVNQNFSPGNELETTDLPDWTENPAILNKIADPQYKAWVSDLNVLWRSLSRRISDSVMENIDRYSIIYVPNRFVVPGGRFRELYYWDTYWIVRGLLLSGMTDTVKGVIGNFLFLLKTYGLIPNGARIYYLRRTQPPLLTPMVYNYVMATGDVEFLKKNLYLLEMEFDFWMKNRTTDVHRNGKTYTLARYFAESNGPRPESYSEDYANSQVFIDDARKQEFFVDIKSAAESGWDFSGRWFIEDASNNGNLTSIHSRYIIPADLNAFIYWNAVILSKFNARLGHFRKAYHYGHIARQWKHAITAVLWNEDQGSWFDFDNFNQKQREYFYPSNMAPLWTKCYDERKEDQIAEKVVGYLEKINIKQFMGGIPTSLNRTGEQWDLPNAWPPLQTFVIQGLAKTKNQKAQDLALILVNQWVHGNYLGYQDSHEMYEKYSAEVPGQHGGGGEYVVQAGFGWTNGAIFDFMDTYGDRLNSSGMLSM